MRDIFIKEKCITNYSDCNMLSGCEGILVPTHPLIIRKELNRGLYFLNIFGTKLRKQRRHVSHSWWVPGET